MRPHWRLLTAIEHVRHLTMSCWSIIASIEETAKLENDGKM
jgi:hypothetical protein